VLQDIIDRQIEIARCCRMEMNVRENSGKESLKGTIPSADYDRSETAGVCEMF
jgi:hypothetical protein